MTPGLKQAFTVRGTVDGTIQGNDFKIHVYWDNNRTGVYNGTIRPSGRIEGTVYGKEAPSIKVDWYSDTTMPCAPLQKDANGGLKGLSNLAHGTPTPIHHAPGVIVTGRPRSPATTPIPTPPRQAQDAPIIRASPSVVEIPARQTEGTTTLTWDAGKDHPYAEVWVRVDDQDETRVLEKGKGSLQVKVEADRTYLYSLSDAGERLATVVVKAKQ